MKIVRLACGLGLMAVWLGACAQRAPEASAPPTSSAVTSPASPPPAEAAPMLAPPSPAPAPEPQGLRDDSNQRKSAEDNREFSSLEAAERALNQAKADLDRLALAAPSPALGPGGAHDGAAEKKERSAARAPKADAAASSAPTGLCENACHAFSSLTRAASAVCRLDGDSGAHCTRAKRVLADSQLRVANCSCPAE